MKGRFFRILGQAMAILFSSHISAFAGIERVQLTQRQTDSLVSYLQAFPVNTQLSIAIVNGDKVIYAGVVKEKDSFRIVPNEDSIFEIGSLTKVFTSILLADFVNKGIVRTSDPIKNFFDFPLKQSSADGSEVTLGNLANHTSGLPRLDMNMVISGSDKNNPYKDYNEGMLEDYLRNRMKLDTTPGLKYSYSNLGGGLLGFILCKKSKKSYEQLLQENIFGPLGMNSSTTDPAKVKDRLVAGRQPNGTVAESWTFTDAAAGAGAIRSSARDMATFIWANFTDNKVLQLPREKTFTMNKVMDIGLGWIIKNEKNRDKIYWHNGGTGGYRSCLALDVNNRRGVAILSNVSAFHAMNEDIDKLCFALLNTL